ncbi:fluoride efflux transporter CrcB [Variovorax sp. PCZ-1]|uniref:fluoride efflux transporter CrcB n=1 Tax=Variovorax sp. PCZ-1 TaxID=2835533 RepID=UPI001BD11BFE|nr:fluoride efflux transporter CrcB [Variovorax sp. PCZ-1]MBS7809146.1 fluoride efflux transporter CrcB [Variovorax sp. PCZ-1]
MTWINYLLVFMGAGAGGVFRWMMTGVISRHVSPSLFWFGTLSVNVLGALLIGVFAALLARSDHRYVLLVTGLLGGFTTFSAFSLEAVMLMRSQAYGHAVIYISASVLLCLIATTLGFWLTSKLFTSSLG